MDERSQSLALKGRLFDAWRTTSRAFSMCYSIERDESLWALERQLEATRGEPQASVETAAEKLLADPRNTASRSLLDRTLYRLVRARGTLPRMSPRAPARIAHWLPGERIVLDDGDRLLIRDMTTGNIETSWLEPGTTSWAMDADGTHIAMVHDRGLTVRQRASRTPIVVAAAPKGVQPEFSPAGQHVLFTDPRAEAGLGGYKMGKVTAVELKTGRTLALGPQAGFLPFVSAGRPRWFEFAGPHHVVGLEVAWTKRPGTSNPAYYVQVWDLQTASLTRRIPVPSHFSDGAVHGHPTHEPAGPPFAVSSDGGMFATGLLAPNAYDPRTRALGAFDGQIRVFDTHSGAPKPMLSSRRCPTAASFSFHPSLPQLVAISHGNLCIFDTRTGTEVAAFRLPEESASRLNGGVVTFEAGGSTLRVGAASGPHAAYFPLALPNVPGEAPATLTPRALGGAFRCDGQPTKAPKGALDTGDGTCGQAYRLRRSSVSPLGQYVLGNDNVILDRQRDTEVFRVESPARAGAVLGASSGWFVESPEDGVVYVQDASGALTLAPRSGDARILPNPSGSAVILSKTASNLTVRTWNSQRVVPLEATSPADLRATWSVLEGGRILRMQRDTDGFFFDRESGAKLGEVLGPPDSHILTASAGNRTIVLAVRKTEARVYDFLAKVSARLSSPPTTEGTFRLLGTEAVTFRDHRTLVTSTWDTKTGALLNSVSTPDNRVRRNNGPWALVITGGVVEVLNTETGTLVQSYEFTPPPADVRFTDTRSRSFSVLMPAGRVFFFSESGELGRSQQVDAMDEAALHAWHLPDTYREHAIRGTARTRFPWHDRGRATDAAWFSSPRAGLVQIGRGGFRVFGSREQVLPGFECTLQDTVDHGQTLRLPIQACELDAPSE